MKLVLNTNIVVSALIWGGEPYKLIHAATEGDIELYTNGTYFGSHAWPYF